MRRLIVVLAAVALSACSLQRDIVLVRPTINVGSKAPALAGKNLDGRQMTVNFAGQKTVLVFWGSWCGPCRQEQPGLTRIATDLAVQGVQFVGVTMRDNPANARAFVQEFHVQYTNLLDDGKIAFAYEVDSPPSVILVDAKGVVVGGLPGEFSENQLRALITNKLMN
jgi:cytochrome c biogenesis protein CcmG/thiol:disulfide interchange protein DsbE